MIKIKQLFIIIIILIIGSRSNAQENCVNFSMNDYNETTTIFENNSCVTISANTSLKNLKISNYTTINIPENISLTINNIESRLNQELILNIKGTLIVKENPRINANIKINNDGILQIGDSGNNNVEFYGNSTKITNNGIIQLNKISFKGKDNLVKNNSKGNFNINGSLDINDNYILNFENYGHLFIAHSYDNNKFSKYVNCGIIEINNGFNLRGGKVINTGTFIQKSNGVISLGNYGELLNYGYFKISGTLNGNKDNYVHNEGRLIVNDFQFSGFLTGPSEDNKLGFIYLLNTVNPNGLMVGPNLEIRKINNINNIESYRINADYSSIFNGLPNYIDSDKNIVKSAEKAGVSYGCTICKAPEIYTNIPCPSNTKVCTKKPNLSGKGVPSENGISGFIKQTKDWPNSITNGQLVLSSASKGLVLTRTVESEILEPVEGMLIYDTDSKCIKMFTSARGWNCITKSCKND